MQNNNLSAKDFETIIIQTRALITQCDSMINKLIEEKFKNKKEKEELRKQLIISTLLIDTNLKTLKENESPNYNELSEKYKDICHLIEINKIDNLSKKELRFITQLKEVEKIMNDNNELDKMISNMKDELGIADQNINTIKIKTNKRSFIQLILEFFIIVVFNMIGVFALSGIIHWGTWINFGYLALFILYFSIILFILKSLVFKIFPMWIYKSMGLILFIPILCSIIISMVFPIFVSIDSYFSLLLVYLITSALRKIFTSYMFEKLMKRKNKTLRRKENDR